MNCITCNEKLALSKKGVGYPGIGQYHTAASLQVSPVLHLWIAMVLPIYKLQCNVNDPCWTSNMWRMAVLYSTDLMAVRWRFGLHFDFFPLLQCKKIWNWSKRGARIADTRCVDCIKLFTVGSTSSICRIFVESLQNPLPQSLAGNNPPLFSDFFPNCITVWD